MSTGSHLHKDTVLTEGHGLIGTESHKMPRVAETYEDDDYEEYEEAGVV